LALTFLGLWFQEPRSDLPAAPADVHGLGGTALTLAERQTTVAPEALAHGLLAVS
jgi:hypothetical protein